MNKSLLTCSLFRGFTENFFTPKSFSNTFSIDPFECQAGVKDSNSNDVIPSLIDIILIILYITASILSSKKMWTDLIL